MRLRSLLLAALGSAVILSAAVPAYADHDDQRYAHHDDQRYAHRDDYRRFGHPMPHHDWHPGPGYYAPPVVVSPPAYGYYTPPPVAYPSPGISIGINLP
ncbi:MAG TPA: hypothetical protein VMU81_26260 [Acetobacteraceae bacterium]|jgi:hypothetical protein|nr:hypothetical protein [Acetobacteraceae bacterium]